MKNVDIVIIGAGAVGTAIARELSHYRRSVLVVDKRDDVGGDASKSNSSIICSGFDCPPDTLESRLCLAARAMVEQVAADLDVPFRLCGALMPAVTEEQFSLLPGIYDESYRNNVFDVEFLDPGETLALEPEVNPKVLGSLYIPRDAVIDPFLFVVAQAENASENGVEFMLDCEVLAIATRDGGVCAVETSKGAVETRCVINAAGLFCDQVAAMVGEADFKVFPRKGQFHILDKNGACRISRIIYPIPTPETRGKLLLPTIHGNILIGPTAEDLEDKRDRDVTADELEGIERDVKSLVPNISVRDAITQYCGLRPNRVPAGYHIGLSPRVCGYLGISGIRSTGVSSSLGVAKYVAKQLRDAGFELPPNKGFARRRKGIARFADADTAKRQELVAADSRYGHVVCRCETVTEAEIVEAIRRPVGARSMDAVKRRVRAGMGRCQGGFCGPRVLDILARELGCKPEAVRKNLDGSNMVAGEVRG